MTDEGDARHALGAGGILSWAVDLPVKRESFPGEYATWASGRFARRFAVLAELRAICFRVGHMRISV